MPEQILILDENGEALNARVDIEEGAITLHSRSGTDRNRDYREGLEAILTRLERAGKGYDIFLDSKPAQSIPLANRRLTFSRKGTVGERFNAIVNAMNAGSSSNGAWRRIRIEVPELSLSHLRALVAPTKLAGNYVAGRLPASELRKVTPEQIDRAVSRLLSGEDNTHFAPSTDYDLLAPDGTLLAPKKVFGFALEEALGITARPSNFSAGEDLPAFQLLEAAGYPILRKGDLRPRSDGVPVDDELALSEGSAKLKSHLVRERKPALAAAKRREMRARLGHLECERCHLVADDLGQHGEAVIEVHHSKVAIADMGNDHVTRLSDLQCLCANCHRIVHRQLLEK